MPLLVAVVIAAAAALVAMMETKSTNEVLTDPAGLAARARAAIFNAQLDGMKPELAFTVAHLETGGFKSRALIRTNSLFNRHVGTGAGFWNGRVYDTVTGLVYTTPQARVIDLQARGLPDSAWGEDLRCYDSLDQSVRDFVHNLRDPLYAVAKGFAITGPAEEFFAALAKGNGKKGYVGDPNAKKAKDYVAGLTRTYRELNA